MPRHPRKLSLLALICSVALLASACGGGSGADGSEVSSGSESSDSGPSESPLGDLIGIPFTDEEAMQEYFENLSRVAEAQTAECMLAQGFEYTPVDYSDLTEIGSVDLESREFAVDYGFGIASNPFEEAFEAGDQAFEDPNDSYTSSLSPGEQQAYQEALIGEIDFSSGGIGAEPGGCTGESYNELFSVFQVFEQFDSEFTELEEAYEADPRIVEASSGWATCMAEAGHNYADADGAEQDFQRRYQGIVSNPGAFEEPDLEEGDEETIFFGPGTLTPEFQVQVDELADEERTVATASWDCNEPLREIEEAVQLEYETNFVEENGEAISAALAE